MAIPKDADRVAETSNTTGTGAMSLGGAMAGYRTFSAAFNGTSGDVYYGITGAGGSQWEIGIGFFDGNANSIQRTIVLSSSLGGGKLNLAAGAKVVYLPQYPAETSRVVRIRRPTDHGIEIFPAAGQTASMLRLQRLNGDAAFTASVDGSLRFGIADAWVLQERLTTTPGLYDVELAPTVANSGLRISSTTGNSGIRFDPHGRTVTFYGADAENWGRYIDGTGAHTYHISGALAARIEPGGTTSPNITSVITRQKGDNRYAFASSSRRLKRDIADLTPPDLSELQPRSFVWEMDGHPRDGKEGAGFVLEEVAEIFPAASGPETIDPLALLAGFVSEYRALTTDFSARLARVEAKLS